MTTRNRRRKPTPTMDAVLAVVRERMEEGEAVLPLSKTLGVNRNKLLRLLEGERPAVLADLDQLAQGLGLTITVTRNRRD